MRRLAALLPLCLVAASPVAEPAPAGYAAIQRADATLGALAWRLTSANAALCRTLTPATGITLMSLGQFPWAARDAVKSAFGFAAPLGVEAVAPDSPAARAGVEAGDAVIAINGRAVDTALPDAASVAPRDAALDLLAAGGADRPVTLTLRRGGSDRAVRLTPLAGCRMIVEIAGAGKNARADARVVQVGAALVAGYDRSLLAAILAHEMAHVILRHHDRLDAANVNRSALAAFGRSGALIRRTEDDADRLSVALLYNAGIDPQAAVALWRDHGGAFEPALFRLPNHSSAKDRAATIAAEIARMPAGAPRPWLPPVLATRDQPIE